MKVETGAELKLEAASGTRILYNGCVEINFSLLDDTKDEISVLFLVTREELSLATYCGQKLYEDRCQCPDANALCSETSKKDAVIPKGQI